jgi:hypothetical protein
MKKTLLIKKNKGISRDNVCNATTPEVRVTETLVLNLKVADKKLEFGVI